MYAESLISSITVSRVLCRRESKGFRVRRRWLKQRQRAISVLDDERRTSGDDSQDLIAERWPGRDMSRENSYVTQSASPAVRIEYRDSATRERVHSEVEGSVATLAARAEARLARARAAERELDELAAALDAPLVALLQNDPSACQASERLRRRQLVEPEPSMS
jgi:hypothetical protein